MADHMYCCHNSEKFPQQNPTQLSSKPKTFSQTFIAFLKSTWNFKRFGKKRYISGVIDSEKGGYLENRKLLFQNTLLKWTFEGVLNTAQAYTAVLLGHLSIIIKQN